ncbi:MAG: GNAT family N-acetyltransferase [Acidobacteria bacterium]|nr:GNAT family N-acetyltransferase [Acidobacteriota bacterium]MCA1651160.1 GNAT family N-acetyltransferase [Acidobacteriota bacterium]
MALRVEVSRGVESSRWRDGLPVLRRGGVMLREFQQADAPGLLSIASRPEVVRFSWPAPDSIAAVERFIRSTHEDRAAGRYLGYAIICSKSGAVAGMFELRRLQPDFFRAEAGFFVAPEFRGTGLFVDATGLVIDFAFGAVGIHRIEARVAMDNERSNAVLRKLGAVKEGILEDAFLRDGEYVDQFLWAVSRRRWAECRIPAEHPPDRPD